MQRVKKSHTMARQLPSGAWTSKLGGLEDIEHEALDAINCDSYGEPVQFLKRPMTPAQEG